MLFEMCVDTVEFHRTIGERIKDKKKHYNFDGIKTIRERFRFLSHLNYTYKRKKSQTLEDFFIGHYYAYLVYSL